MSPRVRRHLLLDEGEVVVEEVAHHWVCYVWPGLVGLLGVCLAGSAPFVDARGGWLVLLVGAALALYAGYRATEVHLDRFIVTNMRVFRVSGLLSETRATMPLRRILDITVKKPLLGRLLGYGDFVFESAAQEQGLRDITKVGNVDDLDRKIQTLLQRAGLRGRVS